MQTMSAQSAQALQWTGRWLDRGLGRLVAVTGAALLFAVLLVLVRVRWLPLESVDNGVAGFLNPTLAGNRLAVAAMQKTSLLGSYGFLGRLVALAAGVLAPRPRRRPAGHFLGAAPRAVLLGPPPQPP